MTTARWVDNMKNKTKELEAIAIDTLDAVTGGWDPSDGGGNPEWRKYRKVYPARVDRFGHPL